MPESYVPGPEFEDIINVPKKNRALISEKNFLLSYDLVEERITNIIGAIFSILILPRFFFLVFTCLFFISLFLTIYINEYITINNNILSNEQYIFVFICEIILMAFHEIGHSAACNRLNIRADCFGAGFYLLFPAFYTKLALVKLLERRERVIVFLGGVYFQCLAQLPISIAAILFHQQVLSTVAKINFILIFINIVPVFQFDGYKILLEYKDKCTKAHARLVLYTIVNSLTVLYIFYMFYILSMNLWRDYNFIRAGIFRPSIIIGGVFSIIGILFFLLSISCKLGGLFGKSRTISSR